MSVTCSPHQRFDYKGNVLNTVMPEKLYIYTPFYDGYAAASKMIDSELQSGIINDKCEWVVKPSNKYKEITQIKRWEVRLQKQ